MILLFHLLLLSRVLTIVQEGPSCPCVVSVTCLHIPALPVSLATWSCPLPLPGSGVLGCFSLYPSARDGRIVANVSDLRMYEPFSPVVCPTSDIASNHAVKILPGMKGSAGTQGDDHGFLIFAWKIHEGSMRPGPHEAARGIRGRRLGHACYC